MPTIIRRQVSNVMETRREVYVTSSWQVHSSLWTPPTDVYETDSGLIVKLEIAGMREEDFEVVVEEQVLVIRGQRFDQNERRAYHQMEIRFGKFEIAIGLPSGVDLEQASAEYNQGFLTVIFPKKQAKQIEVE
ncbi:MAG: Hsp20/alpha crystallin family protein [Syntrophothermus sp.]